MVAPYDSCTLYHGFESRSSRDFFRPPIGGHSRPIVSAGPVTHLYGSVSLKTNGMVVLSDAVQTLSCQYGLVLRTLAELAVFARTPRGAPP